MRMTSRTAASSSTTRIIGLAGDASAVAAGPACVARCMSFFPSSSIGAKAPAKNIPTLQHDPDHRDNVLYRSVTLGTALALGLPSMPLFAQDAAETQKVERRRRRPDDDALRAGSQQHMDARQQR